jgi:hypothetical protein
LLSMGRGVVATDEEPAEVTPAPPVAPPAPPQRATLTGVIEANSKLVTAFAAFAGLAAFAQRLEHPTWASHGLSALAILGVVLFGLELMANLPQQPRQWRVLYFELLIGGVTGLLLLYLAAESRDLRHESLWVVLVAILMVLLPTIRPTFEATGLRLPRHPALRYVVVVVCFYLVMALAALLAVPVNALIDRVVAWAGSASPP